MPADVKRFTESKPFEIEVKPTDENAKSNRREKIVPYYTALGHFVNKYAQLESMINGALFTITGVDPRVGKAIFSGTRVKEAISFINRTLDATDQKEIKERLKRYSDQTGLITDMRDKLLHHGVDYDADRQNLMWSNIRAAHIPDKLQAFPVEPKMIDDLAFDAGQIVLGIAYEIAKDSMSNEALDWFRENMILTWRYKPPPQAAQSRTSFDNPQLPKRQRGERNKGRSPKR